MADRGACLTGASSLRWRWIVRSATQVSESHPVDALSATAAAEGATSALGKPGTCAVPQATPVGLNN